MADWRIIEGDCVEQMAAMDEASVDAVICDPPYGLEFMGKDWDRLDADLPQEAVWKGRRGKGGSNIGTDDSKPASRHHVALGAGKKHAFRRCTVCGKRQFSGSPCECAEPEWSIEYPDGAPSSSIRMQRWHEAWAREALRVLKPGGHLLAFGGTRTYHRLVCAIEDAGFEIRDTIAWMYGSGFPKSLDVSKAIDAQAGAVREVVGTHRHSGGPRTAYPKGPSSEQQWQLPDEAPVTAPATPDAERWQGWGTALKPAHEPIVVARKPLSGTVAATVLAHGTGALNVDGCRIGTEVETWPASRSYAPGQIQPGGKGETQATGAMPPGRWPANVVFDPEAAAMLDERTGELTSSARGPNCGLAGGSKTDGIYSELPQRGYPEGTTYGDSGGASRFFYVAKASSAERNAGLDGFPNGDKRGQSAWGRTCNVCGCSFVDPITGKPKCAHDDFAWTQTGAAKNIHPTVKPINLMRWLVRLVTPPGGLVLDPFTGSGTTGAAAVLEGFRFVGIEREAEYAAIARARIAWWSQHPDGMELVKALEAERTRTKVRESGQESLFG